MLNRSSIIFTVFIVQLQHGPPMSKLKEDKVNECHRTVITCSCLAQQNVQGLGLIVRSCYLYQCQATVSGY